MYRVVIADDESIIRKGLRELIEWDALRLEVFGEASDGDEALELIKLHKPHILITDIKMPRMDGIDLINAIKNLDLDTKIIIISAHSDYDFLKRAIALGVESYLLKPLDNDELTSNLKELVNNIELEILHSTQHYQGIELLKSSTLNRLVTNNISLREFKEKASFLDIPYDADQYICAAYSIDEFLLKKFGDDEQTALYAVHNMCAEIIGDKGISFIGQSGQIVFIFRGDDGDNLSSIVGDALSNAEEQILNYLDVSLTFGVGMLVDQIEDVWKSYDMALKMFQKAGQIKTASSTVVRNIISYMEKHYSERLTLKQVADDFYMNTSYLGQLFKRETGVSFRDYISQVRIQKAIELLKNPRLKIYEIAEMVGFTDYNHFLKTFKKITGTNPTEIKKQ